MSDLWRRIGELEVAQKKLNCYPGERLVITDRHFLNGLAAYRVTLLMLFVS